MANDLQAAAPHLNAPASPAELRTFLIAYLAALRRDHRGPDAGQDATLSVVMLAEASLRFQSTVPFDRPLQLAVLGPTQTGKSTIVNNLLGRNSAAVSPLAGFTVQPQGFWVGAAPASQTEWLAPILRTWPRVAPRELTRAPLEQVGFEQIADRPKFEPPVVADHGVVIWDTPDFDSLAAREYRIAVLEITALADAIVLVVSKEKYADLAVWDMLALLGGLGTPLLVCLNKLSDDGRDEILSAMRRRLDDLGPWGKTIAIEPLPYIAGLDTEQRGLLSETAPLRQAVGALVQCGATFSKSVAVRNWLTRDWNTLTAPLRSEHETLLRWRQALGAAIASAVEHYRRDFLDNPQRYDSFRRATLELLRMLELPGIGVAVGTVRNWLSMPARKLYAWGRSLSASQSGSLPVVFGEEPVLKDLIERLLTSLEHTAVMHADPNEPGYRVWRALAERLRSDKTELRTRFEQAAAAHVAGFAAEIHAAANQLHGYLVERPHILNSLRAARAFTDVASIAVAIKTGGAVATDLLFAPALFGLTSALTEGALGAYMQSTAAELKERQFRLVCERLFDGLFAIELTGIANRLADPHVLGLTEAQLEAATRSLAEWNPA